MPVIAENNKRYGISKATADFLEDLITKEFGFTKPEEWRNRREKEGARDPKYVEARWVTAWLLWKTGYQVEPHILEWLNYRDRSSVKHGIKKIEAALAGKKVEVNVDSLDAGFVKLSARIATGALAE